MNLASLSSSDFKSIVKLLKQKEALQGKLDRVTRRLSAFDLGEAAAAASGGAPARGRRRGGRVKRGAMKAAIIKLLQDAGKGGLKVKEIADQLGVKYGNVSVWFYATGKRVKQIRKIGEAKYAWVG